MSRLLEDLFAWTLGLAVWAGLCAWGAAFDVPPRTRWLDQEGDRWLT